MELEAWIELGVRFGIGAWNLGWVLKLGGLNQLKALKPCYATWRPAEADCIFDNCNATNCRATKIVMQHQCESCRADHPPKPHTLKKKNLVTLQIIFGRSCKSTTQAARVPGSTWRYLAILGVTWGGAVLRYLAVRKWAEQASLLLGLII